MNGCALRLLLVDVDVHLEGAIREVSDALYHHAKRGRPGIQMKRGLNKHLSGNEVYFTISLMFVLRVKFSMWTLKPKGVQNDC